MCLELFAMNINRLSGFRIRHLNFLLIYTAISLGAFAQSLEVEGVIILGEENNRNLESGTIRFDASNSDFQVWNGLYWASLSGVQHEVSSVTDIDSNTYRTVKIGDQIWMAENLRTSTFKDNTPIEYKIPEYFPSADSAAWTWFNNQDTMDLPYGKLYNAYAAISSRGLCPDGWRVPADSDWTELIQYLDTGIVDPDAFGDQSLIAGDKMKDYLSKYWGIYHGSNLSGFSARGAGFISTTGQSKEFGLKTFYWTSSHQNYSLFYYRHLSALKKSISRNVDVYNTGFSVRCLKDE